MSVGLHVLPDLPETPLVELLRARVRPEFLVAVYHPDRADPVLWGPSCAVPDCPGALVPITGDRLCHVHHKRFRRSQAPLAEFLRSPELHSTVKGRPAPVIEADVRRNYQFNCSELSGQLQLEVQYGLQTRHDGRHFRLFARNYRLAVEWLATRGVDSILSLPWDRKHGELFGDLERGATAFVRHTRDALLVLQEPARLEDLRVWRPRHFPGVTVAASTRSAPMDWGRIAQPWLVEAAMRWLKLRLASVGWSTAHVNYSGLVELSEFLAQRSTPVRGMDELTRQLLVDFLVWMRNTHGDGETNTKWISAVRLFLNDYRVNGWEPHLPPNAVLQPGEAPAIPQKGPRNLSDVTMSVLTDEENLAGLPLYVLVATVVAIRQGLRIGSVLALTLDCLTEDSKGRPVLRYWNTKRKRMATMPVLFDDVVAVIRRQQEAVGARFPDGGAKWLLPALYGNVDGTKSLAYATIRDALLDWCRRLEVTEPVTWHRFRHTFAMQLLNDGASVSLVQRLLDHSGPRAVAVYAQLTDQTVRTEWEKVRRVDADGQPVVFSKDAEMADAEWAKDEYARLKVTLPNGYCSLPLQQACEMRNACLDCKPYFVTTPEFLPVHEQQRAETLALIERGERAGSQRMVEKNRQVLVNLDTLISSLRQPVDV